MDKAFRTNGEIAFDPEGGFFEPRDMFMAEIFARPTDYLRPQKSSAWLEKAKRLAERNEKIEAMTSKESLMEANKKIEILENSAPPVPEKVDRGDRLLFTVKVVIAEGLISLEGSPSTKLDTFVTLSDEQGNRAIAWHTTPTIYESFSPRWDESFDLSVDTSLWIMISVRDRALVGKHDIVGRAYLRLDPKRFGDFMTFVLPLLSRWLATPRPCSLPYLTSQVER
ncbi:hypothetical protein L227DRAFT_617757 [Lentinus tigrinus ALCF2SS1-6]|uniref:C2 domain-containing protein n=1 Tax=Lentinus tigrinus ALCF2SS1-6 TaxID=1328759 RepID=A0A5C2RQS6_9APHY|nr:hypothetical protein L227DRAFT_617757 [Lentinus tigrinus ALCF2SS1-6]